MSTIDGNQYCVYGQAELNFGLAVLDGINGAGLVTRGFIWQGPYIWYDQLAAYSGYSLFTGWTAAMGYSGSATLIATGWTAAYGYAGSSFTITTGWTASQYSNYGEFPATQ